MRPLKRITKSPAVIPVLAGLIACVIQIVLITSRKRFFIHPDAVPYASGERPVIFALWHGRVMLLPMVAPKNRRLHALISHHRDGQLISRVIAWFGRDTIHGSSSRGGVSGGRHVLHTLDEGYNVGITPDGPRGPYRHAAIGAARFAQKTGLPIVPVAFSASRQITLSSWDRFMLALPFSYIAFTVGAPLHVPPENDIEQARLLLQNQLNDTTGWADRMVAERKK